MLVTAYTKFGQNHCPVINGKIIKTAIFIDDENDMLIKYKEPVTIDPNTDTPMVELVFGKIIWIEV